MTTETAFVRTPVRTPSSHRTAPIVAVVFVIAVVVVVLVPQWGVLTPDTKPELYLNPGRMLERELSSWRPVPSLGSPNYHPGIAPVTAVVWALQWVGAAPWLSQRLLAITLVLVGAAGAALLTRHLTDRDGLVPVVAGIAYAVHPYAVVAGATLPIRLPHAMLPWFVLAAVVALARGGWRRAATAALAYATMGGINGGIVNLFLSLALPVVAVVTCRAESVPWRQVLRRLVPIAGFALLLSLYWLVPTLLAVGSTGTDVAAATEAPSAVASTSSAVESLRGLGMWTLYLVVGGRPQVPAHVGYLTDPVVVTATLALPVLAAVGVVVGRGRARLLATALVAASLPIMVGLHPTDRPSPLGRALAWAFEHVPGAIGFRTTNKVGSLLALGIAILVGLAIAGRWRSRSVAPVVLGAVVLAALPFWTGGAHPVTLDVPTYWHRAAATLDTDGPGRLLFAPGGFLASYDWGYRGVDDLDTSLFDRRDVVWRPTVPAGSRPAHNMLTAFDVGMNTGSMTPEGAAAHLSLLGISDVLVRADSDNIADGGATAAALLSTYTSIDGARTTQTWGPERTQRPPLTTPAPPTPALTHVSLPEATPWQLAPLADGLLVAGDAFAIDRLADAGYDVTGHAIAWVDELSSEALEQRLETGSRIILTDTNQRRRWDIRGLDRSHSLVLAPEQPLDPATARARSLDPATQTTAMVEGGARVTSSEDDTESMLRVDATTPPSFAADGDPSTTWVTGGFGSRDDPWIRIDYDRTLPLADVRIQADPGLGRMPSRLMITTEDDQVRVDVPRDGAVHLSRPDASSWIRVDVIRTRGDVTGPLGIVDITVAGQSLRTGMALPRLPDAMTTGPLAGAVAATPLDVLVTREQANPSTPVDDEERHLLRTFALPDERQLSLRATIRPDTVPAHLLDAAVLPPDVSIESTTPTDLGAMGRASQAFDGQRDTAWRPVGASGRMSLDLDDPRPVREVVVRREPGAGPAVARMDVGEERLEFPLRGYRTRFRLPEAVQAEAITLAVATPDGRGQVPPVVDVEVADITTRPVTRTTRLAGCVRLGTLDGSAVRVRVAATLDRLRSGTPLAVEGCHTVRLDRGDHRYDAGRGWVVDQLLLSSSDTAPTRGLTPPSTGTVRVVDADLTTYRVDVLADVPSVLSTGIAWDPRWEASLEGRELGPPTLVAGYAVGWRVPAGDHTITVTYGPRTPVRAAFVTSAVSAVALLLLALGSRRRT